MEHYKKYKTEIKEKESQLDKQLKELNEEYSKYEKEIKDFEIPKEYENNLVLELEPIKENKMKKYYFLLYKNLKLNPPQQN